MRRRDDVTVVIAAKDEARTIGALVARSLTHACAVIVVDGHSREDTAALAAAAGARVLTDRGRGKGDALRVGIAAVATGVIVFLDADGSHDPDDIPRLVGPIFDGLADHVSGSRLMGGSSELHGGFDEFFRLAGSSFITVKKTRAPPARRDGHRRGRVTFRSVLRDPAPRPRLASSMLVPICRSPTWAAIKACGRNIAT